MMFSMNPTWRLLVMVCLGLPVAACEPAEKVDENSAEFETWIQEQGLEPLVAARATELFEDMTLYGRYGGGEDRWIEYYSAGGVSVFQPDAGQSRKRRLVYFGTWWAEPDRTCFSYPERKLDCYRVYRDGGTVYFIRIEESRNRPAGSLVALADVMKPGNAENYPFVAD